MAASNSQSIMNTSLFYFLYREWSLPKFPEKARLLEVFGLRSIWRIWDRKDIRLQPICSMQADRFVPEQPKRIRIQLSCSLQIKILQHKVILHGCFLFRQFSVPPMISIVFPLTAVVPTIFKGCDHKYLKKVLWALLFTAVTFFFSSSQHYQTHITFLFLTLLNFVSWKSLLTGQKPIISDILK